MRQKKKRGTSPSECVLELHKTCGGLINDVNREFKIRYFAVAVPVADKPRLHLAKLRPRHENVL